MFLISYKEPPSDWHGTTGTKDENLSLVPCQCDDVSLYESRNMQQ